MISLGCYFILSIFCVPCFYYPELEISKKRKPLLLWLLLNGRFCRTGQRTPSGQWLPWRTLQLEGKTPNSIRKLILEMRSKKFGQILTDSFFNRNFRNKGEIFEFDTLRAHFSNVTLSLSYCRGGQRDDKFLVNNRRRRLMAAKTIFQSPAITASISPCSPRE